MKKYSDTEYVYANARIHYVENFLISEEKYNKLEQSKNLDEFYSTLYECGYDTKQNKDIFTLVEDVLAERFSFALSLIKNKEILYSIVLPYDCNNIKAAIKCSLTTGFDFANIYSKCGLVSMEDCLKSVRDNKYDNYYPNTKKACEKALELYAETNDPQMIDIPIDAACFRDMYDIAKSSKEKDIISYVKDRIDVVNIKNALRLGEMMKDDDFASKIFIENGDISKKVFDDVRKDVGNVYVYLKNTKLYNTLLNVPNDFASIERKFEIYLDEKMDVFKGSMFGPSPILRYMVFSEREAKKIRMIYSNVVAKSIMKN